jgi:hypothetical protein
MRWKSEEVFQVLLEAAAQRVTSGLVHALGGFRRPESVPFLFEILEDDLCREDSMECLRELPVAAREFGILTIRGLTCVTLDGPSARCRRRATLRLLSELDLAEEDWTDIRPFLWESDPGNVITAARIGLRLAPETELPKIITALLEIGARLDSVQEEDVEHLLDAHLGVAREIALQVAKQRKDSGEKPNWLSPSWRILNHVLGRALERGHHPAA